VGAPSCEKPVVERPTRRAGILGGESRHRRKSVLEVQNVTAGYGDVTVLWDVSISAPSGTVVALLGPNGAGKTTLLRAVSGLIKPSSGTILLGDQDITQRRLDQRARLGVCHIPEGRAIFPTLTLKENLTLFSPKRKYSESIQKAADTFPMIGMRLNQPAGSLSGGEQQMLAMIRAYITNPRLVLVDEASIGLAPLIVDSLFEFLEQVASEGTTLLIVEQYVERALKLASTVYLLNHGRIAYSGDSGDLSPEEIFEHYLGVEV
jgi:branched-chain amino acid transport system ATP-binding protein